MTVETTHPEYDRFKPKWERMRAVLEGKDAVSNKGEMFLPKLSGQSDREYQAYIARAPFYGATARTHQAITGMVFSRPERIDFQPDALLDDVTLTGMSLRGFAEAVIDEQMAVGRVGIMVDFSGTTDETLTRGMADAMVRRPYVRLYQTETIRNWRCASIGGVMRLVQVVLAEQVDEPDAEFGSRLVDQYRVLDIFEGAYRQRVFRKAASGEWLQFGEDAFPRMGGELMAEIPFVFVGTMNNDPKPDAPPMLALADCNLTHYRVCADYHNALHYMACPTPVISGAQFEDGHAIKLGGSSALVMAQPDAKAYYLEFSGSGLGEVKTALDDLKAEMVTLGSAVLSAEGRAAETARVADLRRVGENASLASMVRSASDGLTQALVWMARWVGASDAVSVELNTDFDPAALDPQQLNALVATWQAGGISGQTLFANLQRAHIVPEDVLYEDEQARMADAAPSFAQGSTPPVAAPSEGMMSRLQRLLGGM